MTEHLTLTCFRIKTRISNFVITNDDIYYKHMMPQKDKHNFLKKGQKVTFITLGNVSREC
jgi:hypothetical protein